MPKWEGSIRNREAEIGLPRRDKNSKARKSQINTDQKSKG